MGIRKKIFIEEYADGFAITVDGERFSFDQEDDKADLEKVFKSIVDPKKWEVKYEEVW